MGQTPHRSSISDITNALPCVVTTTEDHAFTTHSFIRLTDLNSCMPIPRGLDQLNNHKFRIIVIDDTSFSLQDPITFKPIDSTTYPPYITGGFATLVEQEFIYHGEQDA